MTELEKIPFPIKLPPLPGEKNEPSWDGEAFRIGTRKLPVLSYHESQSGWTDDLTLMHEDLTGENHYMDKASRGNAVRALSPILGRSNPTILEIGCSSGFLLKELKRRAGHGTIVGSDFISGPLVKLSGHLRGIPLLQFDITQCPLEDSSFDGVVMLNVLEHIQDDCKALKQVYRILRPGGLVVIEVPAGPHLYDFYDKHLMHYRRYRLDDLKALAQKTGFEVTRASHLGFFLYPLFSLMKKRNRKKEGSLSKSEQSSLVSRQIKRVHDNPLLHLLMRAELAVGKYISYPAGIRCLMVLRKEN